MRVRTRVTDPNDEPISNKTGTVIRYSGGLTFPWRVELDGGNITNFRPEELEPLNAVHGTATEAP
jgi:hypothetical protein